MAPTFDFIPKKEIVLKYAFPRSRHTISKILNFLLYKYESVELAGVVLNGVISPEESTYFVYLALNQAADPLSFKLLDSDSIQVIFPINDSDKAVPLAIFAELIGIQSDPVQFKANFNIKIKGKLANSQNQKNNTRKVIIEGKSFPVTNPFANN